ncbi:hypothetical protein [Sporisorium scitamineum]|uniref:Uncharacterized protein n=1 Tax=Sporisorium scitamineum TaxID=49012 RepID=A0A0F7SCB4_9BASI|nr:hypothetical protein [Sporisorium scitamineum]
MVTHPKSHHYRPRASKIEATPLRQMANRLRIKTGNATGG